MQPSVSVIMLCSANRDAMRARAIASIRAQSYEPIQIVTHESRPGVTIGTLRNEAIARAFGDIIVHADDDDVSHPLRVEEQVSMLVSSGAEATGYNPALFYDQRQGAFCGAWFYQSPERHAYAIGASLAFWKRTWDRVPFADINIGEDSRFVHAVRTVSVSGIGNPQAECTCDQDDFNCACRDTEPRLIASIHGQNTAAYGQFSKQCWKRLPDMDEHCRRVMRLNVGAVR